MGGSGGAYTYLKFEDDLADNLVEKLNKITIKDYEEYFHDIYTYSEKLPADFVDEFNSVKNSIEYIYTSRDYDNRKENIYTLNNVYTYFNENEFNYIDKDYFIGQFPLSMYLGEYLNFTFVNDDGYSLEVKEDRSRNIPLITVSACVPISDENNPSLASKDTSIGLESNMLDNFPKYHAKLYNFINEVSLPGVKLKVKAPYVISAITECGEYVFDLKEILNKTLTNSLRNLTPENYASVFSDIEKYENELPEDFVEEYSSLKSSLTDLLSSYSSQSSSYSTTIDSYKKCYTLLKSKEYKYIDIDDLIKYFKLTPYIMNEDLSYFANKDYYFRFYQQSNNNYVEFYMPIDSEEPSKVTLSFGASSSNKYNDVFNIFDKPNSVLAEKNISFKYVSPTEFVVKTSQGTYTFNFEESKIFSIINSFKTISPSNYKSVYSRIDNNKSKLDQDFLNECNELRTSIYDTFTYLNYTRDYYYTNVFSQYEKYFSLWFDNNYKYFSKENMRQYIYTYPLFSKYEGKDIYNESGYRIKYSRSGKNSEFLYYLPMVEGEGPVEGKINYSHPSSNYSNCENAYQMFDQGEKEGLNWKIVSPYIMEVQTPAGKFKFDFSEGGAWYAYYNRNNLNYSNYSAIFDYVSSSGSVLPEEFVEETSLLKTAVGQLIKYSSPDNRSYFNYLISYYDSYYSLVYETEYIYYSKDALSKYLFTYPYFAKYNNIKFYNEDNYSIQYVFSYGVGKLTYTLPMVEGGEAVTNTIKCTLDSTSNSDSNNATCAYTLFDQGDYLSDYGISFKLVSPYVIAVTTPAGTFTFNLKEDLIRSITKMINDVTPETFSAYNTICNTYSSSLPSDFRSEYNSVKSTIEDLFKVYSNYSSSSNYTAEYLNTYYTKLNNSYTYFDGKNFDKYFSPYPFIAKNNSSKPYQAVYVSEENENCSIKYDYSYSSKNEVGVFTISLPFAEGGEIETKTFEYTTYTSTPKNKEKILRTIVNNNDEFSNGTIQIDFIRPYLIKVTTAAGSFTFNLA